MGEHSASEHPVGRTPLLGRLSEETCRATRHGLPLSLLVFQVEPPREAPRAHHDLTRAVALLARAVVRRCDVVELLGAGQFGVVANTSSEGARALGESLARQLNAFEFGCAEGPVTLQLRYAHSSLGRAKTVEDLLSEARAGLEGEN